MRWAERTGPATAQLIAAILAARPHPQQGYRSCLGIMRLGKAYGDERLEAACHRALALGATSFRSVHSILKRQLDRQPLPDPGPSHTSEPIAHDNIRGPGYYR